jgi:hypothetical protein
MKQTGNALIVILLVLGILATPVIAAIVMYVGAHNYANEAEHGIKAAYTNNQNVLGQYTTKIQEMAQVPEMYKNDLKEVYSASIEGRYGKDGSKAMFQFIKEHNPNFDSTLYTKLQQVMEAGRNEFKISQSVLIDKKREYETNMGYLMRGFFIKLAGYPKIKLDDYKIIQSSQSTESFQTGIDNGVKLRSSPQPAM